MITGKTKSGFEYELADNIGDDYEVLECVAQIQKDGDVLAIVTLIDHVLGEKQKDAFKDHCRDENGKVSTERMMTEFFDIFTNQAETKK